MSMHITQQPSDRHCLQSGGAVVADAVSIRASGTGRMPDKKSNARLRRTLPAEAAQSRKTTE
jgi:hypothetical protein